MSEWTCQKCFITAKLHWVNSAFLNQSILKEISPEYSLEGRMLKLKLQYFLATWCEEPTHWKRPWSWEVVKAGGEGDDRGWDVGWHHWLNGHEFEQVHGDGEGQQSLRVAVHGVAKCWNNWPTAQCKATLP